MKCPKCGSKDARYKVSRKKFWGHKSSYASGSTTKNTGPRKDFKAECPKCGHEFDASKVYDVIPQEKEKEPEKKWVPRR